MSAESLPGEWAKAIEDGLRRALDQPTGTLSATRLARLIDGEGTSKSNIHRWLKYGEHSRSTTAALCAYGGLPDPYALLGKLRPEDAPVILENRAWLDVGIELLKLSRAEFEHELASLRDVVRRRRRQRA
jgi:hypothetical protein